MSETYQPFVSDPAGDLDRLPANAGLGEPLTGIGSPEGVQTGGFVGQLYFDTSTNGLYVFNGTPGANTGWT